MANDKIGLGEYYVFSSSDAIDMEYIFYNGVFVIMGIFLLILAFIYKSCE